LDRKALPKPEFEAVASEFVAPGTSTELTLAKIWREVLGLKQVGLNDNFFELGGHSLLMVKAQAKLSAELKTTISIVEMFQYPTIRALAQHLDQPSSKPEKPKLQKTLERVKLRAEALSSAPARKGRRP
jgi:acyl carrier protein